MQIILIQNDSEYCGAHLNIAAGSNHEKFD